MVFSRLNASRENVKPWGSEYIKVDRVRGWQNVYARCTRKLSEIGRISKRPPQIYGADNVSRVVELVTYLTRWRRFDGEKIEENIICAICSALLPPDGLWIECDFCRIPPKLQQQLYVVNWMALTSKSPPHLICRELKNIDSVFDLTPILTTVRSTSLPRRISASSSLSLKCKQNFHCVYVILIARGIVSGGFSAIHHNILVHT